MGYQLASTIARSFKPPIATALFSEYGYPAVALHTTVVALITIVTVHLATEAYQRDTARRRNDEERPATGGQAVSGYAA